MCRLQRQTRQSLPPLSPAIARSQSEKALLPKQGALPGRGSVTGEVTPQHSQFIACRQGTGAGLGAGGSQRAAGDKDGPGLLSSSHRTSLPKATSTWRSPRLPWTERRGCKGSQGTPTLLAPQICSPGFGCGVTAGGQRELSLHRGTVPGPGAPLRGLSTKLMAQSRGRAATPPHVWLFGQFTWQGVREQGKRDSGRGFI